MVFQTVNAPENPETVQNIKKPASKQAFYFKIKLVIGKED